jgi:hypothetical protein
MTPVSLMIELRRQGFSLSAVGDGIRVSPASRLSPEQRLGILEHKGELLTRLRSEGAGHFTDVAEAFEWLIERAGIAEYDGGLPRVDAERLALAEVLRRWAGIT